MARATGDVARERGAALARHGRIATTDHADARGNAEEEDNGAEDELGDEAEADGLFVEDDFIGAGPWSHPALVLFPRLVRPQVVLLLFLGEVLPA